MQEGRVFAGIYLDTDWLMVIDSKNKLRDVSIIIPLPILLIEAELPTMYFLELMAHLPKGVTFGSL